MGRSRVITYKGKSKFLKDGVGEPCVYCRRKMVRADSDMAYDDPGLVVSVEHKEFPRSKGGDNHPENLAVACKRCNNLRGNIAWQLFDPFSRVVIQRYPNAPLPVLREALPQTGGMFGKKQWLFDVNKQEHQTLLFYTALKLKPLSLKKDGTGKIDKAFLQEYSKTCPEVALYKDYKSAITLRNNFVNKMFVKLHEDKDTMHDGRLRSSYTYTKTTTGRLSSVDLNLQNLVSRGDWAPHLKRVFVSLRRYAIVKFDFSANEVRDWCNQSGDKVLRESFYKGLQLRQQLQILQLENPENWKASLAQVSG